jgi:glycine/D-amino acid oxidase-like deaminating enzyme
MAGEQSTPQNKHTYDIVVVGNGVLGLSLALSLARRRMRVALVGAPQRPWAATTAAGAMLGCFGEVTAPMLKSEYGKTKLELGHRAGRMWNDWLAGLIDEAPDISKLRVATGTVVMLNSIGSPTVDDANFAAIQTAMELYKEPYESIEPSDVEWLDPFPTARPLRALFIPNEHAVHTPLLLERLERAFLRAGGVMVPELAVSLEQAGDRIDAVALASGDRLAAPHVILASGARSQVLLDTLPRVAARIPRLCSGMGVSVLLRGEALPTPRSVIRTTNRAFACGLHMVPRGPGEIYVGATNIIVPEAADTPVVRDFMFLLECATRQLRKDLWEVGAPTIQVGNRPVALDGFPLIGSTDLEGLWLVTGTYRDGLHLSPLIAAEMTRRILGEPSEVSLDRFRPVRRPIQAMTRDEIIETAIEHMLATGHEANWQLGNPWLRFIDKSFRTAYVKFADELDPEYTPPPEIFAMARVTPKLAEMLRGFYAASRASC